MEVDTLIKQANQVYNENWPQTTLFERAIFCSWSCEIGDCKFCYMSSQPKGSKGTQEARASVHHSHELAPLVDNKQKEKKIKLKAF